MLQNSLVGIFVNQRVMIFLGIVMNSFFNTLENMYYFCNPNYEGKSNTNNKFLKIKDDEKSILCYGCCRYVRLRSLQQQSGH